MITELIIIAITGFALGSFLSALTYRLPRGENITTARSRCPSCDTALGVRELVPLLSWLAQRGRCRHCQSEIHWRYPVIEMMSAALVAGIYILFGWQWLSVVLMLFALTLLAEVIIDLEHGILPDALQLILFLSAIPYHGVLGHDYIPYIVGSTVGLCLFWGLRAGYYALRRIHGLGWGDVKLMAIAGLWVGVEALPLFLLLSGIGGVVTALLWRLRGSGPRFPFGPAMAMALGGIVCLDTLGYSEALITFIPSLLGLPAP